MQFAVWAPHARSVDLMVMGRRLAMAPSEGGWFRADDERSGPGTDYAFSLDGSPPRADPRSPWQPGGVEGPSRAIDHSAFEWSDQSWAGVRLREAVLYELHVGTFTPEGTFEGAISRLDHLVALGVTAVELMPVASFPGRWGWGYDGVALFAPHERYGGPAGLKRLVDAAHDRGLAVLLDVVYNHLGPAGNHLAEFGPYLTGRHHTPWGDAVNLDGPGSDEVRSFLVDNARQWLRDYHLDGLRLDAVHALVDTSPVHFLEELAGEVDALSSQLGRLLWLIAESDLEEPRLVRSRAAGGYGLDAVWHDAFHHALHVTITGERAGYYSRFGPGDLAPALTLGYQEVARHRLVGYAQNHDQVGNRAAGERLGHLVPAAGRAAAAAVLTTPLVPLLFMGEEWGASTPFQYFTDHDDPELARAVSEGRRLEFESFDWAPDDVPDPQDPATFERSQLRWQELAQPGHAELLEWYRALIELRRGQPGRADPAVVSLEDGVLVQEHGGVRVLVNLGRSPRRRRAGAGETVLLASGPDVVLTDADVVLPAYGVAVLSGSGSGGGDG